MIKQLSQADQSAQLAQHIDEIVPKGGLKRICEGKDLQEVVPMVKGHRSARKVTTAVQKLYQKKAITTSEQALIEAIILPETRPAIDIVDDDYTPPESGLWSQILKREKVRDYLRKAIPSVGRIELPNEFHIPFGGTGFVVGQNLLMTNRHVAELFSTGLGIRGIRFIPGQVAGIDFKEELNSTNEDSIFLDVREVVMIHPFWDMALLRTSFLPDGVEPLHLSTTHPEDLTSAANRDIAVIGYPAFDSRNDSTLQNKIFNGIYNIKRLQPGTVTGRRVIRSFENLVNALKHNASTLGGNSGSAVINLRSGEVVGLHFAGKFKDSNYAVPMYDLAKDSFVVDTGINFTGTVPSAPVPWAARWRVADPIDEQQPSVQQAPEPVTSAPTTSPQGLSSTLTDEGLLTFRIPVEVTVGIPALAGLLPGTALVDDEKPSTTPDPNYDNRTGYQEDFLPHATTVRIPWLSDVQYQQTARNTWATSSRHVLPYEHFSIVMNRHRRLAFFTAVNIDGDSARSVARSNFNDDWNLDPRIDADAQMQNEYYANAHGIENPLDRGHLVRRLDPCWGASEGEVLKAHHDTFHWTNSSPQHRNFNRSAGIWNKIEKFILDNALASDLKISVFSGPVFRDDDPVYMAPTGVQAQLPRSYWKVVAFVQDDRLAASAYLLSQSAQVDDLVEEPIFGDFRNTQVSMASLEDLTDFHFQGLADHDTFDPGAAETVGGRAEIALTRLEDAVLLHR